MKSTFLSSFNENSLLNKQNDDISLDVDIQVEEIQKVTTEKKHQIKQCGFIDKFEPVLASLRYFWSVKFYCVNCTRRRVH